MKTVNKQQEIWNESTRSIPLDKEPTAYAIEKEKLFPRQSVVCDLGGGTGVDTVYFIKKGHSVILVDISDYGLELAKRNVEALGLGNRLTIIRKDLSEGKLPIKNASCGIVYSRLSLHYFLPKILVNIFKEINRILEVGGTAYITVKSPKDTDEIQFLKKTAKEIEADVFNDKGQIKTRYSALKLSEILDKAEITNYQIEDYVESFLGRKDVVKSKSSKLLLFEIKIKK